MIDGETGWLVEREDEAGFAERIGRLVDDPAMRARMGEAAVARSQAHASGRLVGDVTALYTELAAGRGRR